MIIPIFMWKVSEYTFSSTASRHLMSLPGKQRSACNTLSSPNSDQSLITNRCKEIWATPRHLLVSLSKQSTGLFTARRQRERMLSFPRPSCLVYIMHISQNSTEAARQKGKMEYVCNTGNGSNCLGLKEIPSNAGEHPQEQG